MGGEEGGVSIERCFQYNLTLNLSLLSKGEVHRPNACILDPPQVQIQAIGIEACWLHFLCASACPACGETKSQNDYPGKLVNNGSM